MARPTCVQLSLSNCTITAGLHALNAQANFCRKNHRPVMYHCCKAIADKAGPKQQKQEENNLVFLPVGHGSGLQQKCVCWKVRDSCHRQSHQRQAQCSCLMHAQQYHNIVCYHAHCQYHGLDCLQHTWLRFYMKCSISSAWQVTSHLVLDLSDYHTSRGLTANLHWLWLHWSYMKLQVVKKEIL